MALSAYSTMQQNATARIESPASSANVFSGIRTVESPGVDLPRELKLNTRMQMDGLAMLAQLPAESFPVAFFDPQYRGVLDKMKYGNEGQARGRRRCALQQMDESTIAEFIAALDAALLPSGHLFLWLDKFHLCSGFRDWLGDTALDVVDLINWDKCRIGMGYRSRRATEYCIVLQKAPRKAKGVWKSHNIPDTWREKAQYGNGHPHKKPVRLQAALIEAVSNEGDIVIDPAAGGFSVLQAAVQCNRNFIGCDLNGDLNG